MYVRMYVCMYHVCRPSLRKNDKMLLLQCTKLEQVNVVQTNLATAKSLSNILIKKFLPLRAEVLSVSSSLRGRSRR